MRTIALQALGAMIFGFGLAVAGAMACTQSGEVLSSLPAGPYAPDELASGPYHTCALSAGAVSCWGANDAGALGTGDIAIHTVPTELDAGNDWRELASGQDHTCGVRKAGSLWCWGGNDAGQLGTGGVDPTLEPTFISTNGPVEQISTKYGHDCAIYEDRSLWCWGDNSEGQLGQDEPYPGPSATHLVPVRMGADSDWIGVSTGQGHTCGIRAPGTLWCWGRNTDGELGLGAGSPGQIRAPAQVGSEEDWSRIRCGQDGTCGIRAGGQLWCWGQSFSFLSAPDTPPGVPAPIQVGTAADWLDVSLDTFSLCGLRAGGALFCWGSNTHGELGLGDLTDRPDPTQVAAGDGGAWLAISVGRLFTCARRADGTAWCAGNNESGELGTGDTTDRSVFTPTAMPQ